MSIIAPSILNSNLLNLREELIKFKNEGIEWIHYDVMDFHFVPNLTFGPKLLKDINQEFNFKIDAHMMVEIKGKFEDYLDTFIKVGVDQFTFHIESFKNKDYLIDLIRYIKQSKIRASIALNPGTSIKELTDDILVYLDNVLIMSVNPGFGGQSFMEPVLDKVRQLVIKRKENKQSFTIQIDGGIDDVTFPLAKVAGVDSFVSGSYLANKDDLKSRLKKLV
ncbi:ribulose-phosphate 3-epimerase [Spiroplasma sp. TIUS-1]|uniref:ribulose-phosphate 3-epimerase n=1 Tax=Spiroplasma sp. TIUS-1 TaxID=216963 RepID=UPI00139941AF|nr:ribulose-phosphate 3-epimerase [Spiroplasma sp. TIUS-1]QHX35771.1 ribulose-phosphate 3-epimerase [Spiroplasma sp. TIUS-1]